MQFLGWTHDFDALLDLHNRLTDEFNQVRIRSYVEKTSIFRKNASQGLPGDRLISFHRDVNYVDIIFFRSAEQDTCLC